MSDWVDQKIRDVARRMVERASMAPATWRFTWINRIHPSVSKMVVLQEGELPIVSCFVSEASWYVFTTRRMLGTFGGQRHEAVPTEILRASFGDFKGRAGQETGLMRLLLSGGIEMQMEYEAGKASMAPIYYLRFWRYKYPVLHRLRWGPGTGE